ncbi:MAG: acyl-protein synthetase [Verrucomicrobia bacterium]|jgi:phenylacetate-coenzyme A ligase PaaK-like adenylate-forming protein|nr:acyl-protein synthetase [Verrucomicrobiota bacterium]MBT7066319.1 acyl-protein synthetase [Verrucomicrobiota bacterium]MBT7699277.1 acyl-protein synthetase [Verrucomicrobiota bacterium]
MDLHPLFAIDPYSLNKEDKSDLLGRYLNDLTQYHHEHCQPYRRILHAMGYDPESHHPCEAMPFLPVRLFKMFDLRSAPQDSIVKTMTSSGTSGQEVSRIFLDRNTSANQTKALTRIVSTFLGTARSPMLIIDSESVLKDRNLFSARGAGILGFSMFGTKRVYALDENMELDVDRVMGFIKEHQGERLFLFGFTFMVYQHLIMELQRRGLQLDLNNAVLIHGGGWKKLVSESVTSSEFKRTCEQVCGIRSIHDYYGMVEQTGSIYMECEEGHLHASVFSDIFIRRPHDFSIAPPGEQGLIQTLSVLPESYPGHSLLTEDEGVLLGEDDCPCGRRGKYFKVVGRIKGAEIRGCSDTYADEL